MKIIIKKYNNFLYLLDLSWYPSNLQINFFYIPHIFNGHI